MSAALLDGGDVAMAEKGTGGPSKRRIRMTPERMRQEIAERLYAHRITLGLTTDELAALIGATGGRYRRYERAETQMPAELFYELRKETGVDLNWLIGGDKPEPSKG